MCFRIPQCLAYLGSFHNSISRSAAPVQYLGRQHLQPISRLAAPVQYPDRQLPQLDIQLCCSSSFNIQRGSFLNFISRLVAPVQYLARQLPQLDIQVSCFSLVSPSTSIQLLLQLFTESPPLQLLLHSKMLLPHFSCFLYYLSFSQSLCYFGC